MLYVQGLLGNLSPGGASHPENLASSQRLEGPRAVPQDGARKTKTVMLLKILKTSEGGKRECKGLQCILCK